MNHQPQSGYGRLSGGSKGQVLVLVAVTFVILLAIAGLTTDVGQLFIYMGFLKKGVDAASLAAAGQYREGRTITEMTTAAVQVMNMNGIDPTTVTVQTCETNPTDSRLCTTPRRKLVRVIGTLGVPTIFLHLVGAPVVDISANSIAEAASMDVVVVIDISESMAWDASAGDPLRDPSFCNDQDPGAADGFPGECQPLEEVKRAGINFVTRILDLSVADEQDRIAIVTFANGWSANPNEGTHVRTSGWTSDQGVAIDTIRGLSVYEADTCYQIPYDPDSGFNRAYGPCRWYDCTDSFNLPGDPNWVGMGGANPTCDPAFVEYVQMYCPSCTRDFWLTSPLGLPPWSPYPPGLELSYLPTTNIGGGLLQAGNMFALDSRPSALWVVVFLSDGMANATDLEADDDPTDWSTYPVGFCSETQNFPLCQDWDVTTRHVSGDADYDADDYARDMANFVGCMPLNPAAACNGITGQGAVIFSVGLGDGVLDATNEANGVPYGGSLLRYIARVGFLGDPDPANDPCLEFDEDGDYTAWCGNYYFSPTGNQLTQIFEDIASRIFTRLVK